MEPSLTHTHLKEATGSRAPSAGSQRNNCCLLSLGGIFNFLFLFLGPVFLDSANISTFVFCSAVLQFSISMLTNVKQPVVLFTVVVIVLVNTSTPHFPPSVDALVCFLSFQNRTMMMRMSSSTCSSSSPRSALCTHSSGT